MKETKNVRKHAAYVIIGGIIIPTILVVLGIIDNLFIWFILLFLSVNVLSIIGGYSIIAAHVNRKRDEPMDAKEAEVFTKKIIRLIATGNVLFGVSMLSIYVLGSAYLKSHGPIGIIIPVLGLILIATGWGLWNLKWWARKLEIILIMLLFVSLLFDYAIAGFKKDLFFGLIVFVSGIWVIDLLLKKETKVLFK